MGDAALPVRVDLVVGLILGGASDSPDPLAFMRIHDGYVAWAEEVAARRHDNRSHGRATARLVAVRAAEPVGVIHPDGIAVPGDPFMGLDDVVAGPLLRGGGAGWAEAVDLTLRLCGTEVGLCARSGATTPIPVLLFLVHDGAPSPDLAGGGGRSAGAVAPRR